MNRIFIYLSLFILSISSFAQHKATYEAVSGINFANVNLPLYKTVVGYHLGLRAKKKLPKFAEGTYVNMGILFSLKGSSDQFSDSHGDFYYLEIPIHLGYQFMASDDLSFFGEFGPYFAYGLFGRAKGIVGTLWDGDYKYINYNSFDEFHRFDLGLGFRLGCEFKQKYIFSFGFDFGLIDIWRESFWDTIPEVDYDEEYATNYGIVKNKNIYISLGYKF